MNQLLLHSEKHGIYANADTLYFQVRNGYYDGNKEALKVIRDFMEFIGEADYTIYVEKELARCDAKDPIEDIILRAQEQYITDIVIKKDGIYSSGDSYNNDEYAFSKSRAEKEVSIINTHPDGSAVLTRVKDFAKMSAREVINLINSSWYYQGSYQD